ncbi:MAG: hypothetical protein CMK32_07095 [Porticoccaceae bacterium]|nr:hypothetical protein [Porticoccaceae bacterium]
MQDLVLLQLARVKGLLSFSQAADSLSVSEDELKEPFNRFAAEEWVAETPRGWRLTPVGRKVTADLIAQERESLDADAVSAVYEAFCTVNDELKATITAWQMRDAGTPNDHTDAAYDQSVIDRLAQVHEQAKPVLERITAVAPRLNHFAERLDRALAKVQDGDHTFVARPILDSYHTVWFELHEDLMAIAGLTRAEEAAAGRAQ